MDISEGTTLVDFYADWCGPCALIEKSLEEIAAEQTDLKVLRINIEEQRELAIEHGVQSIPTLIVFQDGEEIKRLVGATTKSAMMEKLGLV